jgi:predicted dienelactone hydrolase
MVVKRRSLTAPVILVVALLTACGPTQTAPAPTAVQTPTPVSAATISEPAVPEGSDLFPLAGPGPYQTGMRTFALEDAGRDERAVGVTVWYPAVQPQDWTSSRAAPDAEPDRSGAPYPLILGSAKVGNIFAPHLASHGFVVAGVNRQDSSDQWGLWLIDYPLDILFALDQIGSNPLDGLEGVVDADHAGVMGYSFDGYNSLAMSGVRVDPESYLARCAEAATLQPAPPAWWIEYTCSVAREWDEFAAYAGDAITGSDDGLWQPMTDPRIRAAMPMAPEGAWLFGERGLAAVDRPTLVIGATADDINIYGLEAAYICEHLGTPDRAMISFVGRSHMMVYEPGMVARMKHFATAFFGTYLQGREDYAGYFDEDFVAQQDDLAWGVWEGE